MHRPIIVTDNRKTYSNAFEMTQGHQHLYECVQPLEAGQIMFTFDPDQADRNRNNFSLFGDRTYSTVEKPLTDQKEDENIPLYSWFFASFLMVVGITIGFIWILIAYPDQTAFNDVYLTQFDYTGGSYSLAYAGKINPLFCIVIAISCACSSVLVGWQSQHVFGKVLAGLLVVLILGLQVLSFVLHSVKLFDNNSRMYTVMLTLYSIYGLHLASTVISVLVIFYFALLVDHDDKNDVENIRSPLRQTWIPFWLTVVEDLNTIVCYVFVVCACNAQSGVHDDSSLFFDVVCVVMIGFLQHVANILMIFHGHVQLGTYVEIGPKSKEQIENEVKHSEVTKIINVIARTRLLIFFMIGVIVVFFYLRIAPTYEEFSLGIPYEILRVLAIITMVSLNTLHSMWYELSHAYGKESIWQSSPQWKIVTTLFIALIFSALVWRNVALSNHSIDKKYLTNFT
jgi:hypothetical protein